MPSNSSTTSARELTPEESLRAERSRLVRERWMHLLLLGFALSVVVHVGIMLRLWWVKLPERVEAQDGPAVEMRLQELPPTVEVVNDQVELPDPSPMVLGPMTTEIDPVPNLGAEEASGNPDQNAWGAPEAPGVGLIAGPGGAGRGIGIGSGKGGGGTSFFGVGGRGTRFAFIVDYSGSMQGENRYITARSELVRSINALPDFTEFYVVLFASMPSWPEFEETGWVRATRANKLRIAEWLDSQRPGGATLPWAAFDRVLNKLPAPPDVIFLLSDGLPTDGYGPEYSLGYHLGEWRKGNRKTVIVNTIGFVEDEGREWLLGIARENHGEFRFVPGKKSEGAK